MYCMHCGKEIPDQATFCPSCGKKQIAPAVERSYEPTRTILFRRLSKLVGASIQLELFFDDESVAILNVGSSFCYEGVDSESHTAFVAPVGLSHKHLEKYRQSLVTIPSGTKDLVYEISATFKGGKIELVK